MGTPVKIVVTADTESGAKALLAFLQQSSLGFEQLGKKAVEAGKHAESMLGQNRMALMELEHVGRATTDALIAGINPIRALAMEIPRVAEAMGNMGPEMMAKIMRMVPTLAGVAVAVTAAAAAWSYYGEALMDPLKRQRELADSLEKFPGLLDKINIAVRAGSITPQVAEKYQAMLTGKTPLYNETTVADAFGGHAAAVKNGFFGMAGEAFPQLTTDPNLRNSRTGAIMGQRQPANSADIATYVSQQMRADKVTMTNDNSNPGDKALVAIKLEEQKIQRDDIVSTEKQIARIQDRYRLEIRELAVLRETAQASKKWKPEDEVDYQATVKSSNAQEAVTIQTLKTEEAQKSADAQKKIDDALNKSIEMGNSLAADVRGQTEAKITLEAQREGVLRGQNYQQEYQQRYVNEAAFVALGLQSEAQFTKAVEQAQAKRLEGEREYSKELQRLREERSALALGRLDASAAGIKSSPDLTENQKAAQLIPVYQQINSLINEQMAAQTRLVSDPKTSDEARLSAQRDILRLQQQQVQVAHDLSDAQNRSSFGAQFDAVRTKLQNQWGTLAIQSANLFSSVFNSAISSISRGITGLIEGTTTWSRALLQIGSSIINDVIEGIVQMGARWVLTQTMMAVSGRTIMASAMAATAPIAAAQSAIWAAPATLSTIATFGSSAATAPGFIGAAEAVTLGLSAFAAGGRPPLGVPSLVGEKGPELFVPDSAGTIIPADKTADMLTQGGGRGFGGGGMGGAHSMSVSVFHNPDDMARHLQRSDAAEKWVVNLMKKHAYQFT